MADKKKPGVVTGHQEKTASVQSHWDGWNGALDNALKKTGWKSGDYPDVHVEFYAKINVVNPGSIVEYSVKLTPGG